MTLTLLFTILSHFSFWNGPATPSSRWLVEVKPGQSACIMEWWNGNGLEEVNYVIKPLPIENWWVIEIPIELKAPFQNLPCIARITEDKRIDWRDTQPNDPAYINQSDMNLIGMPKAWDIARGGITAKGDTIVVAVIDDGYQADHEDLVGNIWFNRGEIPNDGQDNDGNGYIDDYQGLNVSLGNDEHPVKTHGTSVCGIIGARGNNSIGVSGVNWNVKIMLISQANFESDLIEGYEYILDMRKKYRETDGAEGAFVVATNMSGGVDFEFAEDHPMWCEMYDKLGQEGILSVCAAPNNSVSVDVEGDMPTTCPSEFMIAVTNVDLADQIVGDAGFGPIHIDIGAPGDGTINIASGNQYKEFPGTSSAAPHVAGAIALMYSSPCTSLLLNVKSNPSETAERIRDMIFATAKPNNTLNEITSTGRRLQADAAMRATIETCDTPATPDLQILSIRPNPVNHETTKIIFDVQGDTSTAFFELYSVSGAFVYQIPISAVQFEQGFLDLNTASLPAGIYMLTLWNNKQKVTRKLFIL